MDNYHNDHRVRAINAPQYGSRQDRMSFKLWSDDDEEYEVSVPSCFDICPTCRGKGSHVNPSVDCDGLSREDFDEDPDFAESYWSGDYDVTCYECHGRRVVHVPDVDRFSDEDRKHYEEHCENLRDEAEHQRECAAERRMGA